MLPVLQTTTNPATIDLEANICRSTLGAMCSIKEEVPGTREAMLMTGLDINTFASATTWDLYLAQALLLLTASV